MEVGSRVKWSNKEEIIKKIDNGVKNDFVNYGEIGKSTFLRDGGVVQEVLHDKSTGETYCLVSTSCYNPDYWFNVKDLEEWKIGE